ncbi:hypothetical protein GCM10023205_04140 [Yinghuangia aomiensis]|uniref:pPIWI-RE RNaseH domain-containing protein n=1 Tax=Yinghuangia aomiensis TaxID=676205 RepID=A0ABP9GLI9_9ACTN
MTSEPFGRPPFDGWRLRQLAYRIAPDDCGTVNEQVLAPAAIDLWDDLALGYKQRCGDTRDVQPPIKAFNTVLRSLHGDWARLVIQDDRLRLLGRTPFDEDDLRDVFLYWAEAVLPGSRGTDLGTRLGDMTAAAAPRTRAVPMPRRNGEVTGDWWAGEIAAWHLAEQLAAQPWDLDGHTITWRMDTDGHLVAWDHTIPSPKQPNSDRRHQMPRLTITSASYGYLPEPVLIARAAATRLAHRWYGVRTVLLHEPGHPLLLTARTDGPAHNPRLNVAAVAVARRLAGRPDIPRQATLPSVPDNLDAIPLATPGDQAPGLIRAVAPKSESHPLGRGMGMEFGRQLHERIALANEPLSQRMPIAIPVTGVALPDVVGDRKHAGPINAADLATTLDAAGIGVLRLVALWSTPETRLRMQTGAIEQLGLPPDFVATDGAAHLACGGRVELVFAADRHHVLEHGTATAEQRRQRIADDPWWKARRGTAIAVLAETDYDASRQYSNAGERAQAEDQDGKHLSRRAFAALGATTQYLRFMTATKPAPPPPKNPRSGKPKTAASHQVSKREQEAWESQRAHAVTSAYRDLLRGQGLVDARLSHAFGKRKPADQWHVGIWIRRHATRRRPGQPRPAGPGEATVILTAMRPHRADGPWQTWTWTPAQHRWLPHGEATAKLHAANLGVPADDAAIAALVREALTAIGHQLPDRSPAVVYVNGDATERIWPGLKDANLGLPTPSGTPPERWLPGAGNPATQRPRAVIRVLPPSDRLARPIGTHRWTWDAETNQWTETRRKTVRTLFQLHTEQKGHAVAVGTFVLANIPRNFSESTTRPGRDHTRWATEEAGRLRKTAYAHTSVHFTVIPLDPNTDILTLGRDAAVLTNQGAAWDYRQTLPAPLHMGRKVDEDHPHHRRSHTDEEEAS